MNIELQGKYREWYLTRTAEDEAIYDKAIEYEELYFTDMC